MIIFRVLICSLLISTSAFCMQEALDEFYDEQQRLSEQCEKDFLQDAEKAARESGAILVYHSVSNNPLYNNVSHVIKRDNNKITITHYTVFKPNTAETHVHVQRDFRPYPEKSYFIVRKYDGNQEIPIYAGSDEKYYYP